MQVVPLYGAVGAGETGGRSAQQACAARSYRRIMGRMTNTPAWITVASYENVRGRPTPLAAVRA
ncbi:hypothetical protein ABZT02_42390 [Streptomyces sp. NPDC005402]|uniref:hypothetical protein n=1 Tax=Streptomyces sp. NPDC005402 TaxID=3155338 RepID=UPI00339F4883